MLGKSEKSALKKKGLKNLMMWECVVLASRDC